MDIGMFALSQSRCQFIYLCLLMHHHGQIQFKCAGVIGFIKAAFEH